MVCVLSSNITNTTSRVASSQNLQALALAVAGNVGIFLKDQIISLTNSLVRNSYNTVVIFNYLESTTVKTKHQSGFKSGYIRFFECRHNPIGSRKPTYANPLVSLQQALFNACLTAAKLARRALLRLADIHLLKTTSKNVSSHAHRSPAALGGFWQLLQVGSVSNILLVGTASKTKTIGKGII